MHTSPSLAASRTRTATTSWFLSITLLGSLAALGCSSDMGEDPSCGAGKLDCGECVEVATSRTHCGACGNACSDGASCVGGQCTCMTGLVQCGGSCVNLQENAQNCGACGQACPTGSVCSMGTCSTSCAAGLQKCGANCSNLSSSQTDCGQCGRACTGGKTCNAGNCQCTPGTVECGASGCVDLTRDPLNCGQCNTQCSAGQACNAGVCQPPPNGTGGTSGLAGSPSTAGTNVGGTSAGAASGGTSAGASGGGRGGTASGASGGGRGGTTGGTSAGSTSMAGTSAGMGAGGSPSGCTATGFHVRDSNLYDVKCNEFIMRGVNYPYAWYPMQNTQQQFTAIAAAGANSVRIVLANGSRWTRTNGSTLANLITWAKAAKLVSILEVHDTTGYSEQAGSVALSTATSYWTSSEIANAIKGQEAYVIINIANEPNGNNTSTNWAPSHVTAVQALRNAGLTHTLMVDAPNWGQDWQNTMRDGGGASIWNADTRKNLVFSVHMYDVYGMASTITNYFNTYLSRYAAPLVVGEFAADHGGSGNVDEATIMANAESLGIGYLGWSWSGNGGDLATLDMTNNFNASSLTTWGNRLINGANGLKATSDPCTCFN